MNVLWWIRRDLRLQDNQALAAALEHVRGSAGSVIPIFILDPVFTTSAKGSPGRRSFLLAGLAALDEALRRRGSGLILRQGAPLDVLQQLREEAGATAIFAEADFSPYARRRDRAVGQGLPLTLTGGVTVHPVEALHKADGTPYTVFTAFSRFWRSLPFPGAGLACPERLPALPQVSFLALRSAPRLAEAALFPAGEVEARRRLERFCEQAIFDYAEGRNRLDLEGTSALSPYLRFGMISARQAAWAAREAETWAVGPSARQGAETWLNELIWREFYAAILYHFPFVLRESFRPELRSIAWLEDPDGFAAWCEGRTGYPVVDAAMRQLLASGWMHNRGRMITASFLTKDLLIDWREGERFFMQHLLDGDPAANNGGWQWTAGTGTDAAPYFRIFNPVLQGKKFDPQGDYVRRWVPELSLLPDEFIHTPWEMTAEQQRRTGCRIGLDYPQPIIEHALARQRTLAAYRH